MRVSTFWARGFMEYSGDVRVVLPPIGTVVVTGKNGSGKSGLLEIVSYAGWGKTIRGTDPRRDGVPGEACLRTHVNAEVCRGWNASGKKVLTIGLEGLDATDFENNTKAQEHVDGVLGDWDTWRRSCTFSMADDVMFSTASDAERKRLLEAILGLNRFDLAQERCRADLKALNNRLTAAREVVLRAQTRLSEASTQATTLRNMAAEAAPSVDTAKLADHRAALAAEVTFKEAVSTTQRELLWIARHDGSQIVAQAAQLKRQIDQLDRALVCPSCGQNWPDEAHRKLETKKLADQLKALGEPPAIDEGPWREAAEELRTSRDQLSRVGAQLEQAEAAMLRHKKAQEEVKASQLRLLDLEDTLDVARYDVKALVTEHDDLDAADSVLGTRGARAHLLQDALIGLEAAANVWLERIARSDRPLTMKLAPYTEKKAGGTADSISMEIVGAGGGKGYKASSGGERRRIDVAIMLALADIAQAIGGRPAPTMWFDEVFDALDKEGVIAVAGALESLSVDRCVVVITHNDDLIRELTPDLKVHVADGAVVVS